MFRQTWPWVSVGLAVSSAVAQLLVSGIAGRLALSVLLLAASGNVAVRAIRGRRPAARVELDAARAEIARYQKVLYRILSYSATKLTEQRVEITVEIGSSGTDDRITEKRWTIAEPSLLYREVKPITVSDDGTLVGFDELGLVAESHHPTVEVRPMVLSQSRSGVIVLFVFQPETSDEVVWEVTYTSPRLWEPLRAGEVDRLTWTPTASDLLGQPALASEVEVTFYFPPGPTPVLVREVNGNGLVRPTENLPEGRRRVVWSDDAPRGKSYSWELFARRQS